MKIQTLWSTPIVMTTIDNELLLSEMERDVVQGNTVCTGAVKLALEMSGVMRVCKDVAHASLDLRRLRARHCEGMRWDNRGDDSEFRLFIGLEHKKGSTGGDADNSESGAIVLHDPRSGCVQTMAPGMPFGRPLTVQMSRGRLLAFPSWMRWSMLPVDENDEIALLQGTMVLSGMAQEAWS